MKINHAGAGRLARWAALAAAATLAACGGGGGDSAGAPAGQGTLSVALTDAPSCYEHVYVTVEKVRVHLSGGAQDRDAGWEEIVVAPPKRLDLLELTNGVVEELGSVDLPAGRYSQIRLVLAENGGSQPLANAVQPVGGTEVALRTPSAQQSGLKLNVPIDVEPGELTQLLLDFDACKSVVKAGNSGNYNLKPVLRVTPRVATSIQGYVTSTLALNATTVSAQQDGAIVRSTVPDASGKFVLGSLPAGDYDVVITADGRATAVVASVPVTTGTTVVSGTATAIVLPASAMNEVAGTVAASTAGGTGTVAVTDATVGALQEVRAGTIVQVASTAVDAVDASYALRLPVAAPVLAPYATTGLSFAAQPAAAGKYRVQAAAAGRTPVQQALDLAAGDATLDLLFAAP